MPNPMLASQNNILFWHSALISNVELGLRNPKPSHDAVVQLWHSNASKFAFNHSNKLHPQSTGQWFKGKLQHSSENGNILITKFILTEMLHGYWHALYKNIAAESTISESKILRLKKEVSEMQTLLLLSYKTLQDFLMTRIVKTCDNLFMFPLDQNTINLWQS